MPLTSTPDEPRPTHMSPHERCPPQGKTLPMAWSLGMLHIQGPPR